MGRKASLRVLSELAQKPRKAKARKAKGVRTSGSEGAQPGLVPGDGKGRGVLRVIPTTMLKPEKVQLPDSSESSDTDEESEEGALPPSPSHQESKAAQPIEVSVEVHVVPVPDQDVVDVSESPLDALSHMTLGTHTGSELPRQRDSLQPPSRDIGEDTGRHLTLDPARPSAELMGRIRAYLSPTRGSAPGGVRVPALSGDDLVALEGWISRVGWTDLPLVQPKQVECSGVRVLIQALKGTVIHLVQLEDDESDTSNMDASDSSLPQDHFEADPLNLTQNGPEREERELTPYSTSPEAMDKDKVLGRDTYLDGGLASDPGMASGRMTDFQSEDMDTTAQPSGAESYSERPMGSQDVWHSHGNSDPMWGEGENETAKRRRLYPKVRPYTVPVPQRIDSGWYQGVDLMDPGEVASPAHRVG